MDCRELPNACVRAAAGLQRYARYNGFVRLADRLRDVVEKVAGRAYDMSTPVSKSVIAVEVVEAIAEIDSPEDARRSAAQIARVSRVRFPLRTAGLVVLAA